MTGRERAQNSETHKAQSCDLPELINKEGTRGEQKSLQKRHAFGFQQNERTGRS